ncbi:MAG: hypothetical protein NC099_00635 [Corallococcus sp.]|nr:hypothetical protein [Bacillota bacterium]MCM1533140.1 hypothetical protein [Corallococcus sp.]
MTKKKELKKSIEASRAEIDNLTYKLQRSMVAIIEAIVENRKPSDKDIEYFKTFSALIDVERANLQKLTEQLATLN